jgi:hypothetical protein
LTPVQKARLQGFNASLKTRGVVLTLEGSELVFNALLQPFNPDAGEFTISEETRNASKIHILRDAAGVDQLSIGSVFKDTETGRTYRVTRIEDQPVNIALVFYCESSE